MKKFKFLYQKVEMVKIPCYNSPNGTNVFVKNTFEEDLMGKKNSFAIT